MDVASTDIRCHEPHEKNNNNKIRAMNFQREKKKKKKTVFLIVFSTYLLIGLLKFQV
jgi:beta-lactamase regulating signal transducer with metallopeptidase domain